MSSVTIEELLRDPEPERIKTGRSTKAKNGKAEDEEIVVYLRRPTEIEKQICIGAANAARRNMRARLTDESSEEHKYLLRETLAEADPQALRDIWINGELMKRVQEMQFNSLEDREYVPEPEGDFVSAEEVDQHEASKESAEEDRRKHLIEAITNVRRELAEEADHLDDETLIKSATPAHIETIVGGRWTDEYSNQIISRFTYADSKHRKPYFKTLEQVQLLRSTMPDVYTALSNAHNALLLPTEPDLGN